jgi:hypothetical protein
LNASPYGRGCKHLAKLQVELSVWGEGAIKLHFPVQKADAETADFRKSGGQSPKLV